jgi:hypothetical protein
MQTVDLPTRTKLREFVRRAQWRPAIRALGVSERAIRHAMAGQEVRLSTACALRSGLALAAKLEPTP